MSLKLLATALVASSLLYSCSASKPTAHVIINNESSDGLPVEMNVSLVKDKSTNTILARTPLRPGLQFLPSKKIKKGSYFITVGANHDTLLLKQPLTLDTDRWIIITYTHKDSANIIKYHGILDTTHFKKINGKYANLDLYVESRRPPNL